MYFAKTPGDLPEEASLLTQPQLLRLIENTAYRYLTLKLMLEKLKVVSSLKIIVWTAKFMYCCIDLLF